MIENDTQLDQARAALMHLERAVQALRTRIGADNTALFNAMAEDYRGNIMRIRSEMDAFLGLDAVGEAAAPMWMVLEGETISRRNISSRLLSEWLDRLRKSLYGMTSFLQTGRMRASGRPEAALLEATDPHVVMVAPGSIRVGLRIPEVEQQLELSADTADMLFPSTYQALERILSAAVWGASDITEPPDVPPDSRDEVIMAARFAARLAPSRRDAVRSVTFLGMLVTQSASVRLTSQSRDRLDRLVKLWSHVSEETITGKIREIDLDKHHMVVRERGSGSPDVKCRLPQDLVPSAEALLNRVVRVRGLISSTTPDAMDVRSIEPAE